MLLFLPILIVVTLLGSAFFWGGILFFFLLSSYFQFHKISQKTQLFFVLSIFVILNIYPLVRSAHKPVPEFAEYYEPGGVGFGWPEDYFRIYNSNVSENIQSSIDPNNLTKAALNENNQTVTSVNTAPIELYIMRWITNITAGILVYLISFRFKDRRIK